MLLTQQNSSLAAQLLGDPALIEKIAVGGAVLTIFAVATTAKLIYDAIEEYEADKYRKGVEDVIDLWRQHLSRIKIPGYNETEVKSFPEIFQIDAKEPTKIARSLHFTVAQIKDFGRSNPWEADISLSVYYANIKDAINYLKRYYLRRLENRKNKKKESQGKDIKSCVLAYLLFILEKYCYNFQGYNFDIAYLQALLSFIVAYGSSHEKSKVKKLSEERQKSTRRFDRLSDVYISLDNALVALKHHRETLSLEETIKELKHHSQIKSEELIRILTKMIIPNSDWDLVDTVSLKALKNGILQRSYINRHLYTFVWHNDKAINIPDSLFKTWVMKLAKFHTQSVDPEKTIGEILPPCEIFKVPDLARLKQLIAEDKSENTDEIEAILREVADIKALFEKCNNYLTRKIETTDENVRANFIPVQEDNELIARAQKIAEFATLIYQIIWMQYYCVNLIKSLKKIGEYNVADTENPDNFHKIFTVIDELWERIKISIKKNQDTILEINAANRNAMRGEDQQIFPNYVTDQLEGTVARIKELEHSIKAFRNQKIDYKKARKLVRQDMFDVANSIAKAFDIPLISTNPQPEAINAVAPQATVENTAPLPNNIPSLQISTVLDEINKRIFYIYFLEQPPTDEMANYHSLRLALIKLQLKADAMYSGAKAHADQDNLDRAQKTQKLLLNLCQQTKCFLGLSRVDRMHNVEEFLRVLNVEVLTDDNDFLDIHQNPITKTAATLFNGKHFQTESRHCAMAISVAAQNIRAGYRV